MRHSVGPSPVQEALHARETLTANVCNIFRSLQHYFPAHGNLCLHFDTLRAHPRFPTVKFLLGIHSGLDSKPLATCCFLYLCWPWRFPSHLRPNKLMREVLEYERKQTNTVQSINHCCFASFFQRKANWRILKLHVSTSRSLC